MRNIALAAGAYRPQNVGQSFADLPGDLKTLGMFVVGVTLAPTVIKGGIE